LSNSVGAIAVRTYSDEVMTVKIGVEGLCKPNQRLLLNAPALSPIMTARLHQIGKHGNQTTLRFMPPLILRADICGWCSE
jgi:hypothetical protein